VDPFAFLKVSQVVEFASSIQEQISPALAHQRNRSYSTASHGSGGSAISKNGVVYQEYYIAKYDYEPEIPNYLPFAAGQLIKIIRKHPSGWWDGELAGRRGWFPSNYLYSDSSRLVRVRSNSLESVCPFFDSTLSKPYLLFLGL
jgi:SH3 domain